MKIYVLGSNGMLGRYVSSYFSNYFETIELNRCEIDATEIKEEILRAKLFSLGLKKGDIIINCVGVIKPIVDSVGIVDTIKINSVFPRVLSKICDELSVVMIHPTTDCVYDGRLGNYDENSIHDITDVYGRTKSLGEPNNCMVIRTSIIGEELKNNRSLVEWVKSKKGCEADGYIDHLWNGVTCLEWSKYVKKIIDKGLFWRGVRHIFSPKMVSKYELLEILNKTYKLDIKVNKVNSDYAVNRTLSSIHKPIFDIIDLSEQIEEMKNYKLKL
jgi:dTDP-4-dehydrorhamnose reductase